MFAALAHAERVSVVTDKLLHYRVGMKTNLQANNHLDPFDHISALYKLKYELICKKLYPVVEKSYINLALNNSMYTLFTMKNANPLAFEKVVYRAEIYDLNEMQILGKECDYFKNSHHYKQYQDAFAKK